MYCAGRRMIEAGGECRGKRRGSDREDMAIAAQSCRDDEHRRQHHDVEHHIFDDGDERRCPQAARVSVGGENHKGCNQRPLPANAQGGDDLAHADQLQRDVGHGGENAGNRHGDRKPTALVAPAHIVGQGYVTVAVAYAPETAAAPASSWDNCRCRREGRRSRWRRRRRAQRERQ